MMAFSIAIALVGLVSGRMRAECPGISTMWQGCWGTVHSHPKYEISTRAKSIRIITTSPNEECLFATNNFSMLVPNEFYGFSSDVKLSSWADDGLCFPLREGSRTWKRENLKRLNFTSDPGRMPISWSFPEISEGNLDVPEAKLIKNDAAFFDKDVSTKLTLGGLLKIFDKSAGGEPEEKCSQCQNQSQEGESYRASSGYVLGSPRGQQPRADPTHPFPLRTAIVGRSVAIIHSGLGIF